MPLLLLLLLVLIFVLVLVDRIDWVTALIAAIVVVILWMVLTRVAY